MSLQNVSCKGSQLELSEETIQGVLAACREEIGYVTILNQDWFNTIALILNFEYFHCTLHTTHLIGQCLVIKLKIEELV